MCTNQCFHFTYLSRANKINQQGLIPRAEENSKAVKDSSKKVSFSDGKYAAAGLFANFYRIYTDIKSGKRTAENSRTDPETIDKVIKSDSFEQFLGDGMYLMFDGTNIENTGGNNGHINPFDAGTKEVIPTEMLKVCTLKDTETGEIIYSKYDYALYLMCSLSEDDLKKMPEARINDMNFYKETHQSQMERIKNGKFIEEVIPLSEFCDRYRNEISQAEQDYIIQEKKAREVLQPEKRSLTEDYLEAIEDSTDLSYRLDSINGATREIRADLVREKEQDNDNPNIG